MAPEERDSGGDVTLLGTHKVTGEETWTFLPADEAGCLYLRNDLTGTTIELDRGDAAGSFVYREHPWGSPTVCWLRDLSRCVARGFASQDTIDMLELGEGERFSRTVADQVEGRAHYIDKALGGIAGWQLTGRRGHVVLQGVWGVEVWLISDGFLALSSLCHRALFVRQGVSCYAPEEEASNFMAMDRLFTWLESHCGDAVAKSHLGDPEQQVERERMMHIAEDDADVARLRLWLPPLHDPSKRAAPPKPQTPSNSELGWLAADWEPSSRPQTRYTTGTYSSRPVTRGSNINRWSAPTTREDADHIGANLVTLERMAADGIISIEQFEACLSAAHSRDEYALTEKLKTFQGSHHLEHQINYFYSMVESLRKQLEQAEKFWTMEEKDLHVGMDDALLTLVRETQRVEEEKAALGPPPLKFDDEENDESEIEEEEDADIDEPEEKKLARQKDKDRKRLQVILDELQQRVDDCEEERGQRHEALTARQHYERKALQHQISDFQGKIKTAKELFREAKELEESRKLQGLSDPRRKERGMSKVLQRPRAIKDNRFLLDTTAASTHPFEDQVDAKEFQERYGLMRGDEAITMLSNTTVQVKEDDGMHTNDRNFVIDEFKELVGHTRPRVRVATDDSDDLADASRRTTTAATSSESRRGARATQGARRGASTKQSMPPSSRRGPGSAQSERDQLSEEVLLKKKLAILQNVSITKTTRAASKPRSDRRHVLDYMLNEQDKSIVFREKEVRAVFSADGQDYLTEMPTALDWTAHVPLGHEREVSREEREKKHELQRFAESETLRRFALMREQQERKKRDSPASEAPLQYEEEVSQATSSQVAEHVKKQHQGSWTWASKHMRKARASSEHRYTMNVSKGMTPTYRYKDEDDEEGFDYKAAARNTEILVKRAIPSLKSVWTPTWDLSEELFEGMSKLDSPKRRGLWSLISEADGILPAQLRGRAATMLVYAYRCFLAKLETRLLRTAYQLRMYVRLQCNMRVAVARRKLPRLREIMAEVFAEREAARLEKIRLVRIKSLTMAETSNLSDDDKVFWMVSQPHPVDENLARRLLGLCEGDVARAMGLAGFAPSTEVPEVERPPTVIKSP